MTWSKGRSYKREVKAKKKKKKIKGLSQKAFRVSENYIAKKSECNTGRLFAFYLVFINELSYELWDQKKAVMIQFNSLTTWKFLKSPLVLIFVYG